MEYELLCSLSVAQKNKLSTMLSSTVQSIYCTQRRNERGTIPRVPNRGAGHKNFLQNLSFEHRGAKLASCPRCHAIWHRYGPDCTRQSNGCSTSAPRSSAAYQWKTSRLKECSCAFFHHCRSCTFGSCDTIGVARTMAPIFRFLVVLWFERRCSDRNTVDLPNVWTGYVTGVPRGYYKPV